MTRRLVRFAPLLLLLLAGCVTYSDGYRDGYYSDGGYYYPAEDGYGDYYAGELWSLRVSGGHATERRRRLPGVGNITAIVPDATGELYVVTHDGRVRRIVAGP